MDRDIPGPVCSVCEGGFPVTRIKLLSGQLYAKKNTAFSGGSVSALPETCNNQCNDESDRSADQETQQNKHCLSEQFHIPILRITIFRV